MAYCPVVSDDVKMSLGYVIWLDRWEQKVEGRVDAWLACDANVATNLPHEHTYLRSPMAASLCAVAD